MKKQFYAVSVLSTAMFLAACDGDNGRNGLDGTDGEDGFNSLVATRSLPVGDADCLGGGLALDSGLDTNRNDVLDAAEVQATEFLECAVTPTLRALHASPDAPPVNIWIDGTPALTDVDYNEGSGFVGVGQAANVTDTGADVNVQVEGIIPGGNAVVIDADLPLEFGTETSVIAVNEVAGISPLVITNPIGAPIAAGNFRAQVVHAAPNAPAVDVYVTAFDADLTASSPVNLAPLAFQDFTPPLEVPEGDYQIRITLGGDATTVVYDSGEITLAAGGDLMIVATQNVFLGASAVQLVVLDGSTAAPLYDTSTPAAAVAAHLSPDAPPVDVIADIDATAADEALKLAENIAFTEYCLINNIPAPADYTLSIAASADNSIVALQFPFAAAVNQAATAIVSGFLSSGTPAIQAIPLGVDGRSVATETRLRLTHASPSTPNVDIYLLAAGADINTSEPAFTDVPFGADTGVLSIAPATYDVYVTATGSKTPAISVPGFVAEGGAVLDVVARDPANDGSEGALPLPLVIAYDDTLADCTVTP